MSTIAITVKRLVNESVWEVNAVADGTHLSLAVIRDGVLIDKFEQDGEAAISEEDARISAGELLDANAPEG